MRAILVAVIGAYVLTAMVPANAREHPFKSEIRVTKVKTFVVIAKGK